MKKVLSLLFISLLFGLSALTVYLRPDPVLTKQLLKFQEKIDSAFLHSHLSILASDSMEGRETGKQGQKKAAYWLAEQYKKYGLKPAGDDNTYFQKFKLTGKYNDSTVFITYSLRDTSVIDHSTATRTGSAEYSWIYGRTDSINAEIVFAGFGIQDPGRKIDHLSGTDLAGKWIMMFSNIPYFFDGDTLVDPSINARSRYFSVLAKNAAGVLLISSETDDEFKLTAKRKLSRYNEILDLKLEYLNREPRGLKGLNEINPELAAKILGLKGAENLIDLKDSITRNIRSFTPWKTGKALFQIPYTRTISVETENIAAILEGSDPLLKDEVVVLTAHYDHEGIGSPDSSGDDIYNGADDNASGTIAILNVAYAFSEAAQQDKRPRRSILFLSVSGEEKGLLGSRFYSDHPVFPVENTVANLNIDMIGRTDVEHDSRNITDYSYIIGADLISTDLDSILVAANSISGEIELDRSLNDLNDPNQFYRRSDHWNFGRLGIPFVFFFSGVHPDYHRPSDEADKIRYRKMAKITRTVFATTVLLSNTESPPVVDNQRFIEITDNY